MFRIKFPTKRIFRIFPILRTDGMAPFCNLFMERPSYIIFLGHFWLENDFYALFPSNGTIPDPLCPEMFWLPPIILRTGKATDFKFSRYIRRVHPNKSPL